ncbi:hypothetical protein RB595_000576 [Gaeumannomyces hyphopodioides]
MMEAQQQPAPGSLSWKLSSHPITLLTFLAFRVASLLVYLFGLLFTDNMVMIFIITILLLAADFYYLKNIAGRRLVGLRWWNEVDPQTGESHWVFESSEPGTKTINPTDNRFFWLAIYAQPLLWIALAILAVIRFKFIWLPLPSRSSSPLQTRSPSPAATSSARPPISPAAPFRPAISPPASPPAWLAGSSQDDAAIFTSLDVYAKREKKKSQHTSGAGSVCVSVGGGKEHVHKKQTIESSCSFWLQSGCITVFYRNSACSLLFCASRFRFFHVFPVALVLTAY